MNRRFLIAAAVTAALATAAGCTSSTSSASSGSTSGWKPRGTVTMLVPFGAGGGSDLSGRSMAAAMEKAATDLKINVENREGGSGAVGYSYFLGKRKKGEYLLATETALLALPMTSDVRFTYRDFTPIMKVAEDFTLAVVKKDSPFKTCSDLADAARSTRVVVGISGATGLDNVVFTLLERQTGAKLDRVPFESGGELTSALLGGQIQVASLNPGEVIGQLRSGDLRALCAFAEKRYDYPDLKDIPTAKEQGIDVSYAQYRGLIAPGGITPEMRDYWIDVAKKAVATDEYKKYISGNYLQPNQAAGDDFTAYLKQNNDELSKVLNT